MFKYPLSTFNTEKHPVTVQIASTTEKAKLHNYNNYKQNDVSQLIQHRNVCPQFMRGRGRGGWGDNKLQYNRSRIQTFVQTEIYK